MVFVYFSLVQRLRLNIIIHLLLIIIKLYELYGEHPMFGTLITRSKFIPTTGFQDEHIMFEIWYILFWAPRLKLIETTKNPSLNYTEFLDNAYCQGHFYNLRGVQKKNVNIRKVFLPTPLPVNHLTILRFVNNNISFEDLSSTTRHLYILVKISL